MVKKISKYIVAPSVLATGLMVTSPYIKATIQKQVFNYSPGQIRNAHQADRGLLQNIINSFGSPAFAECDPGSDNACAEVQDVCFAEQQLVNLSTYVAAPAPIGSFNGYPIRVDVMEITTPTTYLGLVEDTLTSGFFNGYPNGAPTSHFYDYEYSFNTPEVGPTDGPSNNGRIVADMEVYVSTDYYNSDTEEWDSIINEFEPSNVSRGFYSITVDHVNQAPVVTTSPADFSLVLDQETDLTSVPVTFQVNDMEENAINAVIELSDDNFATILRTNTYNNVVLGSDLNYTFTNLPAGEYTWRVRAVETNGEGYCAGFSNAVADRNLNTTSVLRTINLYATAPTGTPTPTPTATPTVATSTSEPSPTPSPMVTMTPTQETSVVSGILFHDANGNGTQDAGEVYLQGVEVTITDALGVVRTVTTNAQGLFQAQVAPGAGTFTINPNSGNYPNSGVVTTGSVQGAFTSAQNSTLEIVRMGVQGQLPNTGLSSKNSLIIGSTIAVFGTAMAFATRVKKRIHLSVLKK